MLMSKRADYIYLAGCVWLRSRREEVTLFDYLIDTPSFSPLFLDGIK